MTTAEPGNEPQSTPESAGDRGRSHVKVHSWLRDLIVSVAVSTFIILFLYQPVLVEGTSMAPELEDQDRLFINKMSYRVGEIHRG
ncbi:MAG: S26 family signal peptidase, partial [Acidobacteriaceae bacterium]|nr:S26 family signal peptidase [Acidobacteriaceae bacterium]